jgi:hypothetical protein
VEQPGSRSNDLPAAARAGVLVVPMTATPGPEPAGPATTTEQDDIPVHPSVKGMSRDDLEIGFSQAVSSVLRAYARIDELEASLRIAEYRARRAEDERDAVLAAVPAAAAQTGRDGEGE